MTGEPPEIHYLQDPDGEIARGIENLRPGGRADETTRGRLTALEAAEHAVYAEMHDILTGVVVLDPGEFEARLRDLTETLSDLHVRGERACTAVMAEKWARMAENRKEQGGCGE